MRCYRWGPLRKLQNRPWQDLKRRLFLTVFLLIGVSLGVSVFPCGAQEILAPEQVEKIRRERAIERERRDNLPIVEAVYIRLKINRNLRYEDHHALMTPSTAAELGKFGGVVLKPDRSLGGGSERVLLPRKMSQNEVRNLCAKLRTHPNVDSCESEIAGVDIQSTPNDPGFPNQWSL